MNIPIQSPLSADFHHVKSTSIHVPIPWARLMPWTPPRARQRRRWTLPRARQLRRNRRPRRRATALLSVVQLLLTIFGTCSYLNTAKIGHRSWRCFFLNFTMSGVSVWQGELGLFGNRDSVVMKASARCFRHSDSMASERENHVISSLYIHGLTSCRWKQTVTEWLQKVDKGHSNEL